MPQKQLKNKKELLNQSTLSEVFTKRILMMVLFISVVLTLKAQVGTLTNTGDMTVCISSNESYGVIPLAGSTYTWSIIAGSGGAGSISNTATSNLISVNWTNAGTCTLRVIESTTNCTGLPVDIVITVLPGLIPGTVNADQTICYNTVPAMLTATAPTGATGTITYQWESSTDNGSTWIPVAGANGLTYQPAALTQSVMYRLRQSASGGCGDVTTSNIAVTVEPQLITSPIYHN